MLSRVSTGLAIAALMTTPAFGTERTPEELGGAVQDIFRENCVACHGAAGDRLLEQAPVGFDYVLDLDRLAHSAKLVRPGDPDGSRLYSLIRNDQMPFGAADAPEMQLSDADKETVRQWIVALAGAASADRPIITHGDILDFIYTDKQAMTEAEWRDARYFSLAHLHSAGESAANMEIYRQALAKLLNSLSWQPDVVPVEAIDPQQTVFRVRLSDLGWRERDWRRLVTFNLNELIVKKATYSVQPAFNLQDIYDEDASDVAAGRRARAALHESGLETLYIKADWFVYAASHPPLYHDLLRLPETIGGLERYLGIDREDNIRQHRVARGGVYDSGVGLNNRLIERHETEFGAYWISYDFAEDPDESIKDLFQRPLGPYGFGRYVFVEDGGEVIFNLPNGFQGYMLATDEGFRIDTGPPNIVQDRTHPVDSTIVNGVSCIACHSNGMNLMRDEVRPYVEGSGMFPADVVAEVRALHPTHDVFDALLQQDIDMFHAAQRRAGVDPTLRDAQNREPVAALIERFLRPLDPVLAAAEFGMTPERFMAAIADDPAFADIRTRFALTGLPRQLFVREFARLAEAMPPAGETNQEVARGR